MKRFNWLYLVAVFLIVACGYTFVQAWPRAILRTHNIGGGQSIGTWLGWPEINEIGWGDATNVYIAMMENTSAGGSETGQGVVSGVTAILTSSADIAGATGYPLTRQMDGLNDQFTTVRGLHDATLKNQDSWTILLKINTLDASVFGVLMNLTTGGGGNYNAVYIERSSGGVIKVTLWDGSTLKLNKVTTNPAPTSGDLYVAIWGSPGYNVRAGFSATKPTKWSDFTEGDRIEGTDAVTWAGAWGATGYWGANGGSLWSKYKLYYIILAKTCLIDNAS